MNRLEVAGVITMVSMANGREFDNPTMEFWLRMLADVPADAGSKATMSLINRGERFIGPGDVRREAAKSLGLLAPSEVEVVAACFDAVRGSVRVDELHPVVELVYEAMGKARGPLRENTSPVRSQVARAYQDISRDYNAEVLDKDLRDTLEELQSRKMRILEQRERRNQLRIEANRKAEEFTPASEEVRNEAIARVREKLEQIGRKPE